MLVANGCGKTITIEANENNKHKHTMNTYTFSNGTEEIKIEAVDIRAACWALKDLRGVHALSYFRPTFVGIFPVVCNNCEGVQFWA